MKKLSNNKKLLLIIGCVLLLISVVSGGTYAFFAATNASTEYIKGASVANSESLRLEIAQESDGVGKLIPQKDSAIQKAVTGTSGKGTCIDANGNTICKVYSIKVTNLSSVKISVRGTVSLTANNMANLKWTKGTSATTGFPTPANTYYTKNQTALSDDVLQPAGNANDNKTYYIVIWISEIDEEQTDQNKFTGTVTFSAYTTGNDNQITQGVSSTFKG